MKMFKPFPFLGFLLTLLPAGLIFLQGNVSGSPIALNWVHATVRIENEQGQGGTGFLVIRKITPKKGKVFLVTNKHMIHPDPLQRLKARALTVFFNIRGKEGEVHGASFRIPLVEDEERLWREHPNPYVDVLAVDITSLIDDQPNIDNQGVEYSLFAMPEILKKEWITEGEEVLIIGFPLGLHHVRTHSPLVRQGIVATKIGEPIRIDIHSSSGEIQRVTIPGFLVDAAIIPGSSGSPIVLKPIIGRKIGEKVAMEMAEPYLLGIVSATQLAAIKIENDRFPTLAGLGIAFDVTTIRETIELFFE
jgi:hypothetical protein